MPKSRLDLLLAERGLFESRSRAAAAVAAGRVRLGGAARPVAKPGRLVARDVELTVEPGDEYASRGGVKLANALDALDVRVDGRLCLDVGASTGGFTDVLLRRGAAAVTALDVGAGELHPRLRDDARVIAIDGVNARGLEPEALPYPPDLVVVDVSFISVRKVLPAVLACAAHPFDCLALVKPQFELSPERVGKGGVVRAAEDRRDALRAVAGWAQAAGVTVRGFTSSGLPGPAGNRETFVWLAPGGAPVDVDRALAEVEP
jgi:23S rRNA (cytidine1920-2'-O)/16S rRNA (cytidine1409-2'-O)-methyltransferase